MKNKVEKGSAVFIQAHRYNSLSIGIPDPSAQFLETIPQSGWSCDPLLREV